MLHLSERNFRVYKQEMIIIILLFMLIKGNDCIHIYSCFLRSSKVFIKCNMESIWYHIIANESTVGSKSHMLHFSIGIIIDSDGYLFITDHYNHRIIGSGRTGFRCLIGCSGQPSAKTNHLHHLNIVADGDNSQISSRQKLLR